VSGDRTIQSFLSLDESTPLRMEFQWEIYGNDIYIYVIYVYINGGFSIAMLDCYETTFHRFFLPTACQRIIGLLDS
jgi:hypothetical protein